MSKIEFLRTEQNINYALPDWLTGRSKGPTAEEIAAQRDQAVANSARNRANMDQQDAERQARHEASWANQAQQQQGNAQYNQAYQNWLNGPDDVPLMVDGKINKDLLP